MMDGSWGMFFSGGVFFGIGWFLGICIYFLLGMRRLVFYSLIGE